MSPEVGDSRETLAYFLLYLRFLHLNWYDAVFKKFFLVEGKETKNVYICSVKWHKKPQDGHIESVFAVLTKKSDSFKKQKDDRTTPISCIVM